MNLFDFTGEKLENELIDILLEHKNVRIERIISDHHSTDWYDQDEDEWVCLLQGEADLEFEDTIKTLHTGDMLLIPKHQKHRVKKTTKCIWLCVFIGGLHEINTGVLYKISN